MAQEHKKKSVFTRFAQKMATYAGSVYAFVGAVGIVLVWGLLGPVFSYSDTWQLVINTGTTIITFLMVFVIQNTQNRDTKAMQVKLDDIIRVTDAHNALLDLEELDEKELDTIRKRYELLAKKARKKIENSERDTDHPELPEEVEEKPKQRKRG